MGYLKIPNLYKDNRILQFKEIYALEKVHGTSAHIQWSKGKVSFFSGGETHEKFVALFNEEALTEKFKALEYPEEVVIRIHGEAYGGKQQGMSKTYGPKLCFIGFDVRIGDNWLSVRDAEVFCLKFDVEFVPYKLIHAEERLLNEERDQRSFVAIRRGMGDGHIREGVVFRPPFEVKLNDGSRCIAKHKRDEFRETKSPRPVLDPEKLKVLDQAEAIAEEWVVPMRLQHVLGKLFPGGQQPDMSDIPNIIIAMVGDVYTEGKGEIVEGKDVARAIGNRTVQLFKQHLKAKAFGGEG